MTAPALRSIWYVYGIVPAQFASAELPRGLDDTEVFVERDGRAGVAALVSTLDSAQYAPPGVEAGTADVEWLGPRALAHDRVLTWASERGPVIPLPMFSLFSGREAVRTMLTERGAQLTGMLADIDDAREYSLRVYRVDADLLGSIAALSPRLAELERAAAAATPGQRYLLARKLEAEKKAEMRVVTRRLVDEIESALESLAERHVRSPIPKAADGDTAGRGRMVLNASFLVRPSGLPAFQRTVTSLVERHSSHGLRFDFTGPWPPYHFVGQSQAERADEA